MQKNASITSINQDAQQEGTPTTEQANARSLSTLQNMGNAQKMIDVFGQELYIFLQSFVWQERDQALAEILDKIAELTQKESYQLAFNQVISLFSYSEKNNQVIQKYLQLYQALIARDSSENPYGNFKFENQNKTLAFVLDKYCDAKFEKQAEVTYLSFLTRHKNEDFYNVVALLVQK